MHVEAYFLKGDPELATETQIKGDVIWCKTEENLIPGLLKKTVLGMEAMLPRLDEFNFVIRTNLSSFFVFSRLLKFLELLPATGCYYASSLHSKGVIFGSGAGIILSPDLVKYIIASKQKLMDQPVIDDVMLGHLLLQHGKKELLSASRMDFPNMETWLQEKDAIPDYIYHFRCKHENPDLRNCDEVFIQNELVKMFYR